MARLPERFSNWHSIYNRVNRWSKNGVLDHAFGALQEANVINIQVDEVSLDSTIIQVHLDYTWAIKKRSENQKEDGHYNSRGGFG